MNIYYEIGTAIAWFVSVIFAFITNRKYVFKSEKNSKKAIIHETVSFFCIRGVSLLIHMALMVLMIQFMNINLVIAKIFSNVVIVIINYVASKYFIFKKQK